MKLFLFKSYSVCLLFIVLCLQQVIAAELDYSPYPKPDSGYVTDHADLLSADDEIQLERWLLQVEEKSNVEIIVVTINSLADYKGAKNQSIEFFATALFNTFGIGNLPRNDGVLLLISKKDRKARIELGKYYAHDRDGDAARIMQNVIISQFKRGNYRVGIIDGTEAIIAEFAGMEVAFPWYLVGIIAAVLISILIGISFIKAGKRGWGYVFIGIAIILFLLALYLIFTGIKNASTAGGSGGFGGGSSGGGGATGSW
jgi:uncharacterized protein